MYKVYFNLTYQLLIILTEFSLFSKDFPWDHGVVCIYYVPRALFIYITPRGARVSVCVYLCIYYYIIYICLYIYIYLTNLYDNKQKN
jgi:hypothetical protein